MGAVGVTVSSGDLRTAGTIGITGALTVALDGVSIAGGLTAVSNGINVAGDLSITGGLVVTGLFTYTSFLLSLIAKVIITIIHLA